MSKMKKIFLLLIFLTVLFTLEPLFKNKLLFAVPYFENTITREQPSENSYSNLDTTFVKPKFQGTTHAPEPNTLILMAGGLIGVLVRLTRKGFRKIKRYSDLLLATFGLLITSPLLFLAGILIKLTSKGPVVYTQNRVGKNGKIFKIYKLRSMGIDAEKGTGAVWAKKNDPRVTRIGSLLRKSRVDEIPQLFNVIKGDMSIIGPRPERPEMVRDFKQLIHDYEKRLEVDPGITGLAQVWFKYDETIDDVKKKIKYDLLYIRKMCVLADLDILARSFVVVLTGKGAQ